MKYLRKFNESNQETYFKELVRKFKIAESRRFFFYTLEYSLRLTPDGLIEYSGTLILDDEFVKWWGGYDLQRIPFKIDRIVGGGLILNFGITTLEGCPSYVEDYFTCQTPHQLTDLKGAPQFVGGSFKIGSSKKLTSLEGGPKVVGRHYMVENCALTSLVGSPEDINGNFICNKSDITDLVGAPRYINEDFVCHSNNKLTSLTGCPLEIRGVMKLNKCPNLWDPYGLRDCRIGNGRLNIPDEKAPFLQIEKLFPSLEDFRNSLDYNYIKGPYQIDLFKFREALDELGIDYVTINRGRENGGLDLLGKYKFVDGRGRRVNFYGEPIK